MLAKQNDIVFCIVELPLELPNTCSQTLVKLILFLMPVIHVIKCLFSHQLLPHILWLSHKSLKAGNVLYSQKVRIAVGQRAPCTGLIVADKTVTPMKWPCAEPAKSIVCFRSQDPQKYTLHRSAMRLLD